MKKGELRKQDEPKIKELLMPEHEIVTIQVAQAVSTFLQLPMDERAAPGTEELTGQTVCSCRYTRRRASRRRFGQG
jgi:hypothetical protein